MSKTELEKEFPVGTRVEKYYGNLKGCLGTVESYDRAGDPTVSLDSFHKDLGTGWCSTAPSGHGYCTYSPSFKEYFRKVGHQTANTRRSAAHVALAKLEVEDG